MKARGSRAQVMHGTAKRTSGGLTKKQLKYNKQGKIVSKKMSARAKKEKRLVKAGYKTKKGTFGSFKNGKRVSGRRSRRRSRRKSRRRQRGGAGDKNHVAPIQPPILAPQTNEQGRKKKLTGTGQLAAPTPPTPPVLPKGKLLFEKPAQRWSTGF